MKKVKNFQTFVWICVFLSAFFQNAFAEELIPDNGLDNVFKVVLSSEISENVSPGDEFSVDLSLVCDKSSVSEMQFKNVEIKINFSNESLMFSNFKADYFNTKVVKNMKTSGELEFKISQVKPESFELVDDKFVLKIGRLDFKAKVRAGSGNAEVAVEICEFFTTKSCNFKYFAENFSIKIAKKPCLLKNLKCSEGTLIPEFDPKIFDYEMNVNYDVPDVFLLPEAAENSFKVTVNRHKLLSPGNPTNLQVAVSGDSSHEKSIYNVTVNRREKPEIDVKNSLNELPNSGKSTKSEVKNISKFHKNLKKKSVHSSKNFKNTKLPANDSNCYVIPDENKDAKTTNRCESEIFNDSESMISEKIDSKPDSEKANDPEIDVNECCDNDSFQFSEDNRNFKIYFVIVVFVIFSGGGLYFIVKNRQKFMNLFSKNR